MSDMLLLSGMYAYVLLICFIADWVLGRFIKNPWLRWLPICFALSLCDSCFIWLDNHEGDPPAHGIKGFIVGLIALGSFVGFPVFIARYFVFGPIFHRMPDSWWNYSDTLPFIFIQDAVLCVLLFLICRGIWRLIRLWGCWKTPRVPPVPT